MVKVQKHNQPLKLKMESKGFRLKFTKDHTFFVDANGKYEPYPIGYITGPHHGGNGELYMSVQGPNGWRQRSFKNESEAVKWALATAKEILEDRK